MKHTLMLAALLVSAAACVTPEAHRKVLGANQALQAEIADMAQKQKSLAAENERLRSEVNDLSKRAYDAAYIDEQKKKLADLLARYGQGTQNAADGVEFVQTPEGFAFRVAGGVLFASGQAALTDQGKKTLTDLATSLEGRRVRIEGHTDDVPIQRTNWGTNLRLSVERGMAVADYLIHSAGLQQDRVSVAGYGEFRPAVAGQDDAARSKNRRVEILLLDQ
jgi:chemotaxis protein MotB